MRAAALLVSLGVFGCPPEPSPEGCSASSESIDFGQVETTSRGRTRPFILRNQTSSLQRVKVSPLSPPFTVLPAEPFDVAAGGGQQIAVTFAPTDGRLHFGELVMSSEDPACEVIVRLKGLGSGALRANPPKLSFTLGKGESQTRELRLENSRRLSLPLELSLTPPATFSLPEGEEVAAGGSLPVLVTARLDDWRPTAGVISVSSHFEVLAISVEVIPSSPRIELSTRSIEIPVVDLDGFSERSLRVRNAGASGDPNVPRLVVSGVIVAHDPEQNVVVVSRDPFILLGENETAELPMRFTPKLPGAHTFQVTLLTSAGDLTVLGTANAVELPACGMEVTPADTLTLHEVPDGGLEGTVVFDNFGNTSCIVDGLRLSAEVPSSFSLSGVVKEQLQVPADTLHQLVISGPRPPDAGVLGSLGYHVFQRDAVVRSITLVAP